MKVLDSAATPRIWVPIPGYAQRVHVLLRRVASLDALEHTLLRLLRVRPRSLAEAVASLGLSDAHREMVESALEHLEDRKLSERTPDGDRFFYTGAEFESAVGETLTGWVFWSGIDQRLIPRVWLGAGPPKLDPEPQEPRFPQEHWPPRPGREQITRELNALALRPDLVVFDRREAGEANSGPASAGRHCAEVAALGMAPRPESLRGIIPGPAGEKDLHRKHLFAAVDISPTLLGEAIAMFHEPDVLRSGLEDRPISHRVDKWISTAFPAGSAYVKAQGFEVNDGLSSLLRVLNIDRRERLHAEAENFFREKAREFNLPERRRLLGEEFESALRRAQTELIISRLRSENSYASRKACADAIELMLGDLCRESTPLLVRFLEHLKKRPQKEAEEVESKLRSKDHIAKRLSTHGLDGRLGPSQDRLRRYAAPSQWEGYIKCQDSAGAGGSLFLWLLPLALSDSGMSEDTDRLARFVQSALSLAPELFYEINDLVAARNSINHPNRKHERNWRLLSPETMNDRIMKVWSVIEQAAIESKMSNAEPE